MTRRPTADRWAVVCRYQEGLSIAEISRQTGFPRHFVSRWISKYNEFGSVDDAAHTGRPKKLSPTVEAIVERKMRGKIRRSTRVIARQLKKQKLAAVSYSTVRRTAKNRGLQPYKRRKTSRLSEAHRNARLEFAKTHADKDWGNVVFTDEHRFKKYRVGNPRHNFVWAKSTTEVPPQELERWGLCVDVWAGISSKGKTKLAFYEGTLDAESYQKILRKTLLPAAKEWFEDEKKSWELQQDKATSHTAISTKRWLDAHGVEVVDDWPTKGDDINPMENIWAILDERLENEKYDSRETMQTAIRKLWDKIDSTVLDNLVDSIPDRLRRIRKARGGSIKAVS
jgi:transposase